MTNTALQIAPTAHAGKLIEVDFRPAKNRRSTDIFMANGQAKATAADPIRSQDDIHKIQEYFLARGTKVGFRNYALFTIGIVLGIRGGDLLGLKVSHFFNRDGSWRSHCTLYEQKTRKTNAPLITPRIQEIIAELSKYYTYSYDDYLFQSQKEDAKTGRPRPINLRQWNHILAKARKECEISEHLSSHSLRKTFAYHTIKQNPNDDESKFALQKMLNHSDFRTTLTYCGITQESMDKMRAGIEVGLDL